MGLLDYLPEDLRELIRNGMQGPNQNGHSGAGDINDFPLRDPRQQQRPPFGFAGLPSRPSTGFSLPRPEEAAADTNVQWLPSEQRPQPPAQTEQNLTAQALRTKGVTEADINAAIGNPELINQLIIRHYGFGSADVPATTGYAPYNSSAGGVSRGDSGQRTDSESGGLDDPRARRGVPVWGRLASEDLVRRSAGNIPYGVEAKNPDQPDSPSAFFLGPKYAEDPPLKPIQIVGPKCDGISPGCHSGGSFGTTGFYRIDGKNLCESCAVKRLRIENLGAVAKTKALGQYIPE
jgi:hypothetical protein